MKIRDIFEKNINRNINGVVKVSDEANDTIQQELEEYVITTELKPHFHKFFSNFSDSFDTSTDNMGVWISGFFGSGKSHFLKMLSYLLENKEVNGKSTIDYFFNKFNDPMEFDMIENCCAKHHNQTILFNVDSLSGDKTKTAIKDVFAQVFYNSLGFHGIDIRVVRFEQFLSKKGVFEQFKARFEEIVGETWDECGANMSFYTDDVIQVLTELNIMSEDAAKNFLYNTDNTTTFNIDSLVSDIKDYVDTKDKDFKLIFMVDEIGQYIGEDMNLMLNLQTLVEDLGTKCKGKVWVIVTSQEAIDHVIKVRTEQFSKIMGRFGTRIHLTSSSVEEVVKKRLLAKNKPGEECLKVVYESKAASLKNTFTFKQAAADLKGYQSEENFVDVYPFVPYQFRLFQSVLNQLRTHDQAGFDTSDNSRNMLGAFRLGIIESKKAGNTVFEDLTVGDNNDGALFSFDRFFDTVSEKLNSTTRELIDRAIKASEEHNGIEAYDVCILKLLYLLRYVDNDIKATIDNIAILMTDSIDADQIALRKKVGESLERLRMQNYISKNGEVFSYLSNEEKEVEIEIKNTTVTSDEMSKSIGEIIFGDIYPSKKAKYGNYNFEFGRFVDNMPIGPLYDDLKLMIITPDNPLAEKDNISSLSFASMREGTILCVMPDENNFYERFKEVEKIEKYNKTKNQISLAQAVKTAITNRVSQAKIDKKQVHDDIEKALKNAKFYSGGNEINVKGASARERLEKALSELIQAVYKKLEDVTYNFKDINDVKALFNQETSITGRKRSNPNAVAYLEQFLNIKYQNKSMVTAAEIYKRYQDKPYGYNAYDIAAMICELIIDQVVEVSYNGKVYTKNDLKLVDLICGKSYIDSVIIQQKEHLDPQIVSKCINIMRDFTGSMDVPTKDDSFVEFAINTLQTKTSECTKFLDDYYSHGQYPKKTAVENAKKTFNEVLLYKNDSKRLLEKIKEKEVALLDAQDDISDIVSFFKGAQKGIYDKAANKIRLYKDDEKYINESEEAKKAYDSINDVLNMENPFGKIANLSDLVLKLDDAYNQILSAKKSKVLKKIDDIKKELYGYVKEYSKDVYEKYIEKFNNENIYIENSSKIVVIDAEVGTINSLKDEAVSELVSAKPPVKPDQPEVPVVKEPSQVNKNELLEGATLKTKGEVDQYIEKLKSKLYKYISDGGIKIE